MLLKSLLSAAVLACAAAAELPAIEIVGNKFFYSNNGSQFLMKGVAYQSDTLNSTDAELFVDPLANVANCKRDIPYLQLLNTNIVRVYALNATQDHTGCMNLLQEAGIYVIADLSEPDLSIDRSSPQWNLELLARYTQVVDEFHNYTNVVGFFAGNEVTNEVSNTDASAFVKAAVRDTKAYIKEKGYRAIPVGYSSNDDIDIRVDLADYFACGDEDESADFFGINMYEWCGSSTFKTSGYQTITQQYQNLGIPIFFSEYGCNEVQPRKFTEVLAIYSEQMTDIWSGGIVYMYYQEANNYGLVTIDSSGSVSTMADFKYLLSQLASISPSYATANSASGSASVTSCPTLGANWAANTILPPTPDESICNCMDNSLTCVVADSVDESDYEDLFDYVCGVVDCSGVSTNGTSGDYGAYSPCGAKQKLNFVLNLYYMKNGSNASACKFDGSASTQKPTTASSCTAVLSSAGVSGLGTVSGSVKAGSATSGASGSGRSGSAGSSSSTGLSSSSTSSKKSGAASLNSSSSSAWMLLVSLTAVGFGLVFA